MIKTSNVKAKLSLGLVLLFMFSLVLPCLPVGKQVAVAEGSGTQTIGDLQIGDKVVDNSWEWEHRLGPDTWNGIPYSGTGVTKPVTWIVVAKDHYGAGGVTLMTEEVIARHILDNSSDRGYNWGSNHWGDSGSTNAAYGLRSFLNGSSYSYASGYGGGYSGAAAASGDGNTYDVTFFDTFSTQFQAAVLNTAVPCRENDGTAGGEDNPYTNEEYTTNDKVFLPSQVELNGATGYNHSAEAVWPYFDSAGDADRIAMEANGETKGYWTRSPLVSYASNVRYVNSSGYLLDNDANIAYYGVRPALTLKSDILISGIPNEDGAYEIAYPPPETLGDLQIGDKVVDNFWQWEHRLGPATWNGVPYSGTGETKPVTWIVVAKDHYTGGDAGSVEGGVSHVTLITEELIGKYSFDKSTNGYGHWGDSGGANATHGIRKFLNGSSYSGSDANSYDHTFYDTMSSDFKNGVLTTTLPNKVWDTGSSYTTTDKVFLPSTTEMGDTIHSGTYPIGEDWGYFTDDTSRIAVIDGNSWPYLSRTPNSGDARVVRYVSPDGIFFNSGANYSDGGIRPALNLSSEIPISGIPNVDGVYVIKNSLYGDADGDGSITVSDAIMVLRHIVGLIDLNADQLKRAKVSGGDDLTVSDAIQILRYIVGLIDDFPVEEAG